MPFDGGRSGSASGQKAFRTPRVGDQQSPPKVEALMQVFDATELSEGLADSGYAVLANALSADLMAQLHDHVCGLDAADFKPAGVGRGLQQKQDLKVRRDEIRWIDASQPATQAYLQVMEMIRRQLNQRLMLGLFEYECHFARYLPGAFYGRHRDAFIGQNHRLVSSILYLNPDWLPDDGGELLLYDTEGTTLLERIEPIFGTMVFFLSEDFPHEVLPARKTRLSLAGLFRVNSRLGTKVR